MASQRATLTHNTWGNPWYLGVERKDEIVSYKLPDGRIVRLSWNLCKGASTVEYQLADGKMVIAVIQSTRK